MSHDGRYDFDATDPDATRPLPRIVRPVPPWGDPQARLKALVTDGRDGSPYWLLGLLPSPHRTTTLLRQVTHGVLDMDPLTGPQHLLHDAIAAVLTAATSPGLLLGVPEHVHAAVTALRVHDDTDWHTLIALVCGDDSDVAVKTLLRLGPPGAPGSDQDRLDRAMSASPFLAPEQSRLLMHVTGLVPDTDLWTGLPPGGALYWIRRHRVPPLDRPDEFAAWDEPADIEFPWD